MLAQSPLGFRAMDEIERQLELKGVYCYIPRQRLWLERRGKRECVLRPLFPGYIPVCLPEWDLRYAVYSTAHVYRPICIVNQKRFVTELETVQAMIAAGEVEAFPELIVGAKVRVARGPLMGKEGILEERGSHQRFVIRATDMMMSAAIEVDARDLEPI